LIFGFIIIAGCSISPFSPPTDLSALKNNQDVQVKLPLQGDLVSVEELQGNLAELINRLDSIHPEPSFTMDLLKVKAKINALSQDVSAPMSHYEAWKYLSQLNPYFQDGHLLISSSELEEQFKVHVQNGGRTFPFEITIDDSQRMFVANNSNRSQVIQKGDEIISINGVSTSKIVHDILTRMHGDSLPFRTALAVSRFSKMYWLLFGDTYMYNIEIENGNGRKHYNVPGRNEAKVSRIIDISEFVQRKVLKDNIGYLRIDRFYYSQEQEKTFFKFMHETWLAFKAAKVKDVIIDVRNNPGGTDHYWHQGIAPYVADKPFSFISKYKVRMTERNIRLGPIQGQLGEVAEGIFDYLIPVEGHNNLRIPGQTYLLMGPLSYSSTILFLTSLQDAKQAVIVGQSHARSCTTGRIETTFLQGSNLELTMPTAIFTRPSGSTQCQKSIKPEILLSNHSLNSSQAITELAKIIVTSRKVGSSLN